MPNMPKKKTTKMPKTKKKPIKRVKKKVQVEKVATKEPALTSINLGTIDVSSLSPEIIKALQNLPKAKPEVIVNTDKGCPFHTAEVVKPGGNCPQCVLAHNELYAANPREYEDPPPCVSCKSNIYVSWVNPIKGTLLCDDCDINFDLQGGYKAVEKVIYFN